MILNVFSALLVEYVIARATGQLQNIPNLIRQILDKCFEELAFQTKTGPI